MNIILFVMGSIGGTGTAVQPAAPVSQEWGVVRYATQAVNIRSSRSTQSAIVGQLRPGQQVKADFMSDNWWAIFEPGARVRAQSQAMGYVYAPLLSPELPSPQSSPPRRRRCSVLT